MKHLNLLVLRCVDPDRTRAFYELLGLRFERHVHGRGPAHFAHEDERGVFELYPADAAAPPDRTGLGFAAEALEAAHARFVQGGYQPGAIGDRAWGRTFVVRDPDGRRVEIKQA